MKIIVLYMKIKLKFKAMLLMLLKINKPVTDGFRMFKLIYVHIEKNTWGICFIKYYISSIFCVRTMHAFA